METHRTYRDLFGIIIHFALQHIPIPIGISVRALLSLGISFNVVAKRIYYCSGTKGHI